MLGGGILKFMLFILLEKAFNWVRNWNLFTYALRQNFPLQVLIVTTQAEENYSYPQEAFFWKSISHKQEGKRTMLMLQMCSKLIL